MVNRSELFRSIAFRFILASAETVASLLAQGNVGQVAGTIMDPAGAVVPGAVVTASDNATKLDYRTTTTSAGAYLIPFVPAGTYTISANTAGFRTAIVEKATVRVAETTLVDMKLEFGEVNEHVVVSDKPALLQTDSAEIGRYITSGFAPRRSTIDCTQ